jgi:Protein of unknown function (DUF1761)
MAFAGLNYLAVIVAAVVAWAASAVWYMSLGKIWIAALGKTPEQVEVERSKRGAFLPFIYVFVADVIIGWVLAGVLGHLGPGQVTLKNGVIAGAFCWFGFVLTTMASNYSFAGRDKRLLLIDAGNWLIVLIVIGAIIGGIGVK